MVDQIGSRIGPTSHAAWNSRYGQLIGLKLAWKGRLNLAGLKLAGLNLRRIGGAGLSDAGWHGKLDPRNTAWKPLLGLAGLSRHEGLSGHERLSGHLLTGTGLTRQWRLAIDSLLGSLQLRQSDRWKGDVARSDTNLIWIARWLLPRELARHAGGQSTITGALQNGGVDSRRRCVRVSRARCRGCSGGGAVAGIVGIGTRWRIRISGSGGRRFLNQRIRQRASIGMDQTPFILSGERIDVAPAEESLVVGIFQVLHARRVSLVHLHIQVDSALVLLAAIDQELFFIALAFKRHARHLLVEHQPDGGGH